MLWDRVKAEIARNDVGEERKKKLVDLWKREEWDELARFLGVEA